MGINTWEIMAPGITKLGKELKAGDILLYCGGEYCITQVVKNDPTGIERYLVGHSCRCGSLAIMVWDDEFYSVVLP